MIGLVLLAIRLIVIAILFKRTRNYFLTQGKSSDSLTMWMFITLGVSALLLLSSKVTSDEDTIFGFHKDSLNELTDILRAGGWALLNIALLISLYRWSLILIPTIEKPNSRE